jgi:hypothetical protein
MPRLVRPRGGGSNFPVWATNGHLTAAQTGAAALTHCVGGAAGRRASLKLSAK